MGRKVVWTSAVWLVLALSGVALAAQKGKPTSGTAVTASFRCPLGAE